MARKDIFEILKNAYNISYEMNKINELFHSNLFYYDNHYNGYREEYTIEELVNKTILSEWKQRSTYLSCEEIRETLKLPITFNNTQNDDIINALEYYHNLAYLIINKLNIFKNYSYHPNDNFTLFLENMKILTDKLNFDIHIFNEEEKIILLPKNPASTAVAEISSEDTSIAILLYNHRSLKGDLQRKREILRQIAQEYEPLLKNPRDGYKEFYKKANALLNNMHIRHNNKNIENNKNQIINIKNEELEKWYDELYQLLLFCILIEDNIKRNENIETFLKKLKEI